MRLVRPQAIDVELVAEHALDGGLADHVTLDVVAFLLHAILGVLLTRLLDQHHGHGLAEVRLRDTQHLVAGLGTEADRDRRTALGGRRGGVHQIRAGGDDLALQKRRPAVTIHLAVEFQPRAQRRAVLRHRFLHVVLRVGEPELQRRHLAEDVLHFGRVDDAGQRDRDPVGALLAYFRLGHAQFVDAVVQRNDVLLDGIALAVGDLGGGQRRIHVRHGAAAGDDEVRVRHHLAHHVTGPGQIRAGSESHGARHR